MLKAQTKKSIESTFLFLLNLWNCILYSRSNVEEIKTNRNWHWLSEKAGLIWYNCFLYLTSKYSFWWRCVEDVFKTSWKKKRCYISSDKNWQPFCDLIRSWLCSGHRNAKKLCIYLHVTKCVHLRGDRI